MEIVITLFRCMGAILLVAGTFFFISSTVGIVRMPDTYNMGHAAGKCDGPGFILSILGVWFYRVTVNPIESIKLLVLILLLLIVNPIVIHAILRMCYRTGIKPLEGTTIHRLGESGVEEKQDGTA